MENEKKMRKRWADIYNLHLKLNPFQKIMAFKDKFLEVIDQYKDFVYIFSFKHSMVALVLLIYSICYPFSLFC